MRVSIALFGLFAGGIAHGMDGVAGVVPDRLGGVAESMADGGGHRAGVVTDRLGGVACAVTDGRAGLLDGVAGFGGRRRFLAGERRSGKEKTAEQQQNEAHRPTVSRWPFGRNSLTPSAARA